MTEGAASASMFSIRGRKALADDERSESKSRRNIVTGALLVCIACGAETRTPGQGGTGGAPSSSTATTSSATATTSSATATTGSSAGGGGASGCGFLQISGSCCSPKGITSCCYNPDTQSEDSCVRCGCPAGFHDCGFAGAPCPGAGGSFEGGADAPQDGFGDVDADAHQDESNDVDADADGADASGQ
jgi:hypothetical protein